MKFEQKNESLTSLNHNMKETHGFSKQYNVCMNKIISFHLRVVFGYVTWIFCERFQKQSRWSNHRRLVTSGVQRSDDVLGDCLVVCPLPNSSIKQQRMVVICYWIYAVCNVIIWRHICVCKPTFWRSLLTQHAYYSTRTLHITCVTVMNINYSSSSS